MPDTVWSRTRLLELLYDPAIGAPADADADAEGHVGAQLIRDAVVSIFGVYGAIYVNDGSTAQTGVTTTPEKLTAFDTDGPAAGMTPAHGSDQITVGSGGVYAVLCQIAFQGDSGAPTTYQFHLRVDGVEQGFGTHRKTSSADVGSCSFVGLLSLEEDEVLTVWVETDAGAGADLTVVDAQLAALRVA